MSRSLSSKKCKKSAPTLPNTVARLGQPATRGERFAVNTAWHPAMRFTSNWHCGQGALLGRSIRISEMLP